MGSAETQASGEPGITFQLDKSWNAEHPRAHPQTAKTAWRQSHAHPVLGRRETNQNNAFTKMTDGQGGRPVSTCHEAVSARVNPESFLPPGGGLCIIGNRLGVWPTTALSRPAMILRCLNPPAFSETFLSAGISLESRRSYPWLICGYAFSLASATKRAPRADRPTGHPVSRTCRRTVTPPGLRMSTTWGPIRATRW